MKLSAITIFVLTIGLLIGCSTSSTDRELKEYMSSYLNENQDVVVFGSAQLKTILDKADYKSFDKISDVIEGQLKELDGALDIATPLYYTVNGPFDKAGSPKSVTMLIKVVDQVNLEKKLTKMGYDINESGDFKYTEDGDMMLGFRGNLAVVLVQGGERDPKVELANHFKKVDNEPGNSQMNEILNAKGDVLMGMNLANLYNASPEKSKMTKEEQKKLDALVKDSYAQTTFRFEDGTAIIETKNMFNKTLNQRMFLKSESNSALLKELGNGKARAGFAMNIDLSKMESLATEFSPEMIDQVGGPQLAMVKMFSGAKSLNDLLTGKAALIMYGEPDEFGSLQPQFSAFVGLKPKGEQLGTMAGSFLGEMADFKSDKKGMSFSTVQTTTATKLMLPKGAENFGNTGISFFIDLEGLNPEEIADMTDTEELEAILKVSRFISFEYGNNGGQLKIIAKEGKENILKQIMEVYVDKLVDQVSKISI